MEKQLSLYRNKRLSDYIGQAPTTSENFDKTNYYRVIKNFFNYGVTAAEAINYYGMAVGDYFIGLDTASAPNTFKYFRIINSSSLLVKSTSGVSFYNSTTQELFSIVNNCIVSPYIEFTNNGTSVTLGDFTYSAERMGDAPRISSTMFSYDCYDLLWNVEDSNGNRIQGYDDIFTIFNGERYYLESTPVSSFSNEDARYKHELSFVSERIILENIMMINATFKNYKDFYSTIPYAQNSYVKYDNLIYVFNVDHPAGNWDYSQVSQVFAENQVTEGTDFTFSGTIEDFAERINASIVSSDVTNIATITGSSVNNSFYGYHVVFEYYDNFDTSTAYSIGDIVIKPSDSLYYKFIKTHPAGAWDNSHVELYPLETKLINIKDSTILEALELINSEYGFTYYIDSQKTIHIKKYQTLIDETIQYGADKSLLSITRSKIESKIITKITGVGSSENIPYYYPNPSEDGFLNGKVSDASYPFIVNPDSIGSGLTVINPEDPTDKFYKLRLTDKFTYGTLVQKYTNMTTDPYLTPNLSVDGLTLNIFLHAKGENWFFVTTTIGNTYLIPLSVLNTSIMDCNLIRVSDGVNLMKDSNGNLTTFGTEFNSGKPVALPANTYLFEYIITLTERPILFNADYYGYYVVWNKITYLYDFVGEKSWELSQSKNSIVAAGFFEHKNDENIFLELEPTYTVNTFGKRILSSAYSWFRINPTDENRISNFDSTKTYAKGALVFAIADGTTYNTVYQFKNAHAAGAWSWDDVTLANFRADSNLSSIYPTVGRIKYEFGKTYQDKDENSTYYGKRYVCTETEASSLIGIPFFNKTYDKIPYKSASQILEDYDFSGCALYKLAWSLNGKEESPTDYGMTLSGTPNLLQEIVMNRLKYMAPQENIMPEIYYKTNGARRFYQSKNYPFQNVSPYIPDIYAGEEESNGMIINKNYQNDGGEHILFENIYKKTAPKEHIENFDDIKPTIKNRTNDYGERIDVVSEFTYDTNDSDELEESDSDSEQSLSYKHPYFFAKLRRLGFNLFDLAIDEGDMVLNITSGPCGSGAFKIMVGETHQQNTVRIWKYDAYSKDSNGLYTKVYTSGTPMRYYDGTLYYNIPQTGFEEIGDTQYKNVPENKEIGDIICTDVTLGSIESSQKDTTDNEVWVALLKDVSTFGTIIPSNTRGVSPISYSDSQVNYDTFVFTNILMPQLYIREAEKELTKAIIGYMGDNNAELFSYNISFSRIFFAQHQSIQENINENSLLKIKYAGHAVKNVYVSSFTYKMTQSEPLPEISVELEDEIGKRKYKYIGVSTRTNGNSIVSKDTSQAQISYPTTSIRKIGNTFIRRNGTNSINGTLSVTGKLTGLLNAMLKNGEMVSVEDINRDLIDETFSGVLTRGRTRVLTCILSWQTLITADRTAPRFEFSAGKYTDTLNNVTVSILNGNKTKDAIGYSLIDEKSYNIYVSKTNSDIYLLDGESTSDDFLVGILSSVEVVNNVDIRHVVNYYGINRVDGRDIIGKITDTAGDMLVDMGTGDLQFKDSNGTKKLVKDIDTTVGTLNSKITNGTSGYDVLYNAVKQLQTALNQKQIHMCDKTGGSCGDVVISLDELPDI